MTQTSRPLVDVQYTDVDWRDLFGDEPGVVGDLDGTAYQIVLPPDSDVAQIGSATQSSLSRVAGFSHKIPVGEPEGMPIPAASGSDRTDLIVVRYDPNFTGEPGPCRLHRIAGTSAAVPTYDDKPPGVEDFPLWAVTRKVGQALSQATVRPVFTRIAPQLDVPVGAPLRSSPLGSVARQGGALYLRTLDAQGVPVWRDLNPVTRSVPAIVTGWAGDRALTESGKTVTVSVHVRRSGDAFTLAAWSDFATLLTGLPQPAIGQSHVDVPNTNQDEFGAWALVLTAAGSLQLRSRWRPRSWAVGGWLSTSFSYVAA